MKYHNSFQHYERGYKFILIIHCLFTVLTCIWLCTLMFEKHIAVTKDHSVHAPSQWEMILHCDVISHWLDTYTEWSLCRYEFLKLLILSLPNGKFLSVFLFRWDISQLTKTIVSIFVDPNLLTLMLVLDSGSFFSHRIDGWVLGFKASCHSTSIFHEL